MKSFLASELAIVSCCRSEISLAADERHPRQMSSHHAHQYPLPSYHALHFVNIVAVLRHRVPRDLEICIG